MPYKDLEVRKLKAKEYSKKYYKANKKKIIKKNLDYKKKLRVLWAEFKATLICQHCGETHPATFDFHHIKKDIANKRVSELIQWQNYSGARKEIKKCIVLCANCHRKHHYEERKNPAL
jgi:hypothetical protein